MKNYELMSKLGKLPAGAEVIFWGCVPDGGIEKQEEDFSLVRQDLEEVEENNGVIVLC